MKTTIDLPDGLFAELKEVAREAGIPMRQLLIDGLRAELARRTHPAPRAEFSFSTVSGEGLSVEVDPASLTARAYDLPLHA